MRVVTIVDGKQRVTHQRRDRMSIADMKANNLRKCKICGQIKDLDDYPKSKRGRSPYCSMCTLIRLCGTTEVEGLFNG